MVPAAAFFVVLACALWGWKILRSGKVFFDACPAPLAHSVSGVSQEIVLVHSPLQRVSSLSKPILHSSGISAGRGKS